MSVAVVKVESDKIILGADSQITRWINKEVKENVKIRKVSDTMGFACAGEARETELFYMFTKTHKPLNNELESILSYFHEFVSYIKKNTDITTVENHYLLVFDGKAFDFYDWSLSEVANYSAIGSGLISAEVALYLGKTIAASIGVACDLNLYCYEPINILEFSK